MPDSPTSKPESDFVCECEEWMRVACAAEPFYEEHERKSYCVLHFPDKEKSSDFEKALQRKLKNRDFNFQGVWFPDELSFSEFEFSRDAYFRGATFSAEADFTEAIFGAEAEFAYATFSTAAIFKDVTFSTEASFSEATFSAYADFGAATFSLGANFSSATFNAQANFQHATFTKAAADFSGATFSDEAHFKRAQFCANANFSSATFRAVANFRQAAFDAPADFRGAAFSAEANFFVAFFGEKANFESATFRAEANFTAEFRAAAVFIKATFSGEASFIKAIFGAQADFTYATFADRVAFAGSKRTSVFSDASSLDLQFAGIEKPDRFLFHTLTLHPHWFINVDPRKFDFTNVKWKNSGEVKPELEILKSNGLAAPHRLLAIACQRLAANCEDNSRYRKASHFRRMAQDAERLETWRGFDFRKLNWWYWLASGYGERPFQALLVLVGILVLFGLLYTQVGFAQWEPRLASEADVATAKKDEVGAPLPFRRALTYSAAVLTFQRPEPKPATTTAQTIVLLETILGPVQAALLALAIRRKFMR